MKRNIGEDFKAFKERRTEQNKRDKDSRKVSNMRVLWDAARGTFNHRIHRFL